MKTLVIILEGADSERIFGDETLQYLRHLMDAGCFGRLEGDFAPEKGRSTIGSPAGNLDSDEIRAGSQRNFTGARGLLNQGGWTSCRFVDVGLGRIGDRAAVRDYYRHLDDELGGLLELLDDETIVLVISGHGVVQAAGEPSLVHDGGNALGAVADIGDTVRDGAFILVAPNCPLQGAVAGVHIRDIVATLIDLGGLERPPGLEGRSLVAGCPPKQTGGAGLSATDEMLIRERLQGLGYLG